MDLQSANPQERVDSQRFKAGEGSFSEMATTRDCRSFSLDYSSTQSEGKETGKLRRFAPYVNIAEELAKSAKSQARLHTPDGAKTSDADNSSQETTRHNDSPSSYTRVKYRRSFPSIKYNSNRSTREGAVRDGTIPLTKFAPMAIYPTKNMITPDPEYSSRRGKESLTYLSPNFPFCDENAGYPVNDRIQRFGRHFLNSHCPSAANAFDNNILRIMFNLR